ncbi:sugar transferase [Cryobacterium sp. TmT2-59]|uniref:sugar transferase n=1 Tax=Cryobacterium sp. TmT2-59 TaxID=1259264 RepID=UPI00106C1947|nr:sugar transferase [Cryobacterium sp. TmT2-59]TFC89814.1 sugar transferase [Cryobacterium sp. TmT2-59]
MTPHASLTRFDTTKRAIDCVVAILGLAVASPVLMIVGGLVAAKLGRPVLFKQDRPGKNGRVFRLYKFRTMKNVDLKKGLISDEQRLSPFGRALRSTSLDELPTLYNVLKGDMSLVGPRPLLVRYLNRYTPEQARRHDVRPGITGLAQVSGRNRLTWEDKFALDVKYVGERGFGMDLWILAKTVMTVAKRDGVSAEGHVTVAEFVGGPFGKEAER